VHFVCRRPFASVKSTPNNQTTQQQSLRVKQTEVCF